MAQNIIDTGGTANDGTGDSIRSGFQKANSNFTEVYTVFPRVTAVETSVTNLTGLVNNLTTIVGLSTGTSKQYVDYSTSLVYNSLVNAITGTTIASTASLTDRVTSLEGGAVILSSRASSLETSTATLASRASSLETSTATLNTRVTTLESTVTDLVSFKTAFSTPGSLTGASYSALTSLVSNSSGSFATRVTNLESSFTNFLNTSYASITYVDTAIATSTGSLASSLQSLRTDFATPGSLTGATYTALTTLVSNSTGSFATRVTNLEATYTNLVSSVDSKASITYVDTAIATSTTSIASSLQALRTDFATPGSLTGATYTAFTSLVSNSTGSFATRVSNLEAAFQSAGTGTSTLSLAVISYVDSAVATSTASIASSLQSLRTDFSTPGSLTGASYTGLTTLVSDSTSSFATRVNTIESNVGTLTTTVTNFAGSINGLEGKYGVTVNNNGAISGFVLNSGGSTSSFIVSADQFKIYTAGGTKIPFSVADDVVTMQNVNIASTLTVGSSPAVSGTSMSGAGAKINIDGTFAMGNSSTNITYNGSQMTLNGNVVATGNINANAVTNVLTAATSTPQSLIIPDSNPTSVSSATINYFTVSYTASGTGFVTINWTASGLNGIPFSTNEGRIIPVVFYVYRDSTPIGNSPFMIDIPPAGTHTYIIRAELGTPPYTDPLNNYPSWKRYDMDAKGGGLWDYSIGYYPYTNMAGYSETKRPKALSAQITIVEYKK
jgi:hypothetical protein